MFNFVKKILVRSKFRSFNVNSFGTDQQLLITMQNMEGNENDSEPKRSESSINKDFMNSIKQLKAKSDNDWSFESERNLK